MLVNRGWIPFGGYRDRLPDVSMAAVAPATISGPHRRAAERRTRQRPRRHRTSDAPGPRSRASPRTTNSRTRSATKLAATNPAARSGSARRLRARVVATRHAAVATLLLCNPVVGFCGCAARALLRPQFSQGVLMQDSRARGRRTLLIVAAVFLLPVAVAFTLYYGKLWRPANSVQQGRAHRAGAAAQGGRPAPRGRHTRRRLRCSPANGHSFI